MLLLLFLLASNGSLHAVEQQLIVTGAVGRRWRCNISVLEQANLFRRPQ